MTVDLLMPYNGYILMLILMTLTLMQHHSGSAKQKHQRCMLLATKQAISIKLATMVGHFLCDLDLDFANVYVACPSYCCLCLLFVFVVVLFLFCISQVFLGEERGVFVCFLLFHFISLFSFT